MRHGLGFDRFKIPYINPKPPKRKRKQHHLLPPSTTTTMSRSSSAAATTRHRYHLTHHLSHSLHLQPPFPDDQFTLDFTRSLHVIERSPTGSITLDRQTLVRRRSSSHPDLTALFSHLPELTSEQRCKLGKSIVKYRYQERLKGDGEGMMQVAVRVEMVTEVETTYEPAVSTERMESALEEVEAAGCGDEGKCAVCWEEFEPSPSREKRIVRLRRCEHVFHRECVVKWLGLKNSCPLCRSEI